MRRKIMEGNIVGFSSVCGHKFMVLNLGVQVVESFANKIRH